MLPLAARSAIVVVPEPGAPTNTNRLRANVWTLPLTTRPSPTRYCIHAAFADA